MGPSHKNNNNLTQLYESKEVASPRTTGNEKHNCDKSNTNLFMFIKGFIRQYPQRYVKEVVVELTVGIRITKIRPTIVVDFNSLYCQ